MLLAAATFGALYAGAVQAQTSGVSFCNGYFGDNGYRSTGTTASSYNFSVNENSLGNTLVGTLAACGDHARDSLTYSVGGMNVAEFNEAFDLQTNKGKISVKPNASIDYERGKRTYWLTATVTDADDTSEATIPFSITVLNVDDPGTVLPSTTDPWVGRQVSFSLSDPDGNPRIYRIEWSRADDRLSEWVRFLPGDRESDQTQFIYTLQQADRWKLIKVTAFYVDDECISVDSYTPLCRKSAEAVFADMVADEEGLRVARQMENSPATGKVRITGGRSFGVETPPMIGYQLLVLTSSIRDADGVPPRYAYHPKTYRWFRVDPETLAEEEISHRRQRYSPRKADFGKFLKVEVSFYDNHDNPETLTSPLTARVERGPNQPAIGNPRIHGEATRVGETLTAYTSEIYDGNGIDPSEFTYQWISNDGTGDTDIQDATGSTYILVDADEGKTIKLRVSFTNEWLYAESLSSGYTPAVTPRDTSSQRSVTAPAITGSPALSDAGSDGQWTPGEAVQVTLTFNEEVNVITTGGTPSIGIQLGGTLDRSASYASGSGTTELVFSYTLTDDDGSHSTMFVPVDGLTLNGGTITSASTGGAAALGHNGAAKAAFAAIVIPNSAATGAPTITGTAQVGQTLTASTSDISDSDGLADAIFTYQWIANDGTEDTNIQDATVSTYTVAAADVGKTIKVRVSFTDDGGSQEARTSAATVAVVAIPNSAATGAPTISGTAQVGQTLTASTSGIADSDGLADAIFTYQWIANDGTEDSNIQNAAVSTYTVAAADEGKTIKVRVSFTDDRGNQEARTSAATVAVAAAPSPLTAAIHDAPESHDGQEDFTFELRFSEEFQLSYSTLRDHAFTVTGGEVAGARRLDRNSGTPNIRWEISISPDSGADVTVELPVTEDCEASGAICTDDGKMLSSPLEFTVKGSPLTVSTLGISTFHNGSDNFKFSIAFSEDPQTDFSYKTLRDHAFTVEGGTVVGVRRLVRGSNTRWEITVEPDSNADVTVELPVTTDCEAPGAICTDDGKMLSSPLEFTVSGPGQ